MSEAIKRNIENYKTAPFDSRFPNQNQTRGCWQNYLDFHRCEKAMNAKGSDPYVCQWYKKVYSSLCPSFWFQYIWETIDYNSHDLHAIKKLHVGGVVINKERSTTCGGPALKLENTGVRLTAGMKVWKMAVFQAKSDGLFVYQSLPYSGSCAAESFPCGTSEGLSEMALVCLSA